ncbi:MAG: methionyl-tRNA formyltransferase [Ilumatobacteraceae bacterium]
MTPRRLVYLGTPEMAVPPLLALVDAGHEVVLVVTRTDKRRGRGGDLSPSPVKAVAAELGLRVSHDLADVSGARADLGVVVAYGRIIPRALLEPPSGVPMVNLHFSLLPRWRGAAPVERALLAGDRETGVCIMRVVEALDAGPVLASDVEPIGPRDTAAALRARLVDRGSALLVQTLARELDAGSPQVGEPVYAAKITGADLRLDWSQPAEHIDRVVRVGGAWTTFRGRRVRILDSALETTVGTALEVPVDGVRIVRVQPEGRGPMTIGEFERGARPSPGERFA